MAIVFGDLCATLNREKSLQLPSGYQEFLQDLKGRIRAAQVQAGFAVNRELILLYWSIGRDLSQRFAAEEWGGKIIDRLARDLQTEFPGVEGFSPRNLRYMRTARCKIALEPQCPCLGPDQGSSTREWYLRAALEYGWSRDVLVLQIKSGLHEREGRPSNFPRALPPPDSDMAEQILKDPYNFDLLTVTAAAKEREIERGLLTHLRDLLLELGPRLLLRRESGARDR
jgi:predicted nuclease of restriction endonuclease-like (RecB) superfamily